MHNITNISTHALIIKDEALLLVKQARGLFTGLLDLPGGKLEHGEDIVQALARITQEESGVIIETAQVFNNYSLVNNYIESNREISLYQIGLVYKITHFNDKNIISFQELEDSSGADWFKFTDLEPSRITPFVLRAVMDLRTHHG